MLGEFMPLILDRWAMIAVKGRLSGFDMGERLNDRDLTSDGPGGFIPIRVRNFFARVQREIFLQVGPVLAVVRIGRALWGLGLAALHALVRALRRRVMPVTTGL